MEGFGALTLRCFVAGTFLADGDSKGPGVGVNCRWKDMIIPCVVKGSDHKILEVAVSKSTGYEFQRQRSDGAVLVMIQR